VATTKAVLSKLGGQPLKHSRTEKQARHLARQLGKFALLFLILDGRAGMTTRAAEVKPETVAAFEHYIAVSEARMDDDIRDRQFLIIDRLPDSQRKQAYGQLQQGQIYIEELQTQEDHHAIRIPNGLVHHWAGVIFIRNASLSETLAVMNDYEDEPSIYKPEIRKAKLIEQNGNQSKIYLQFYSKSIVTVVLNAYFDVVQTQMGSTRVQSVSHSTRIVEVMNPGAPDEHERTDGYDHGYMWRLSSYWRVEEKDGGIYLENESITLTRTVPALLGWLINPLTKSIPRDVLHDMLTDTQKAVVKAKTTSKEGKVSQGGPALRRSF
jgi:hypothetical protein